MPSPRAKRRGGTPNGETTATDEIGLYELIIRPSVDDEFLSKNNLGLGNYSRREYWQQVESFRKGLYAESAFARKLFDRAVYDTKCALAVQEFETIVRGARQLEEFPDEDVEVTLESGETVEVSDKGTTIQVSGLTKNQYIAEHGDRCWNELGQGEEQSPKQAKLQALEEHAGLTSDWTSPFHRMIMARHEASRSRFARLIDNATGRVREILGDSEKAKMEQELGRH